MLFIAGQFSSDFDVFFGKASCLVLDCFAASINFLIFNITIGRICLFYTLTLLNTDSKVSPMLNKILYWIGMLNSPNYAKFQMMNEKKLIGSQNFNRRKRKSREWFWPLKIIAWFAFWTALVMIIYVSIKGTKESNIRPEDAECGPTIYRIIGSVIIIWNILQLLLVLTLLKFPDDALGMKREVIVLQCIFTAFWCYDGFMQLIKPDSYEKFVIYTDLSVMTIHALLTFSYPLILMVYRDRKYKHTTTPAEYENFKKAYNTNPIIQKQVQLTTENNLCNGVYYALEELKNLSTFEQREYLMFYRKFIDPQFCTWELDLPSTLLSSLNNTVHSFTFDFQHLQDLNEYLLRFVFVNYGFQILRNLGWDSFDDAIESEIQIGDGMRTNDSSATTSINVV
jgi:hypothetical protein